MYCTNCGEQIDNSAEICTHCGVRVGKIHKYCHNCGTMLGDGADYCINCGVKVMKTRSSSSFAEPGEKQKWVAILLAVFTGALGIHDFYLGYKTNGIIKLILSITGVGAAVSSIWALVDLIQICLDKKTDADGNYLV